MIDNRPETSRRALLKLIGLSPAIFALPALAQSATTPAVLGTPLSGAARTAAIAQAQAAFNGLRSIAGRFRQTDPNGRVSTGQFFMRRPRKLRLQYDAPATQLLIADGTNVSIQDLRLRTINRYPQSATPLRFLLADQINLSTDVRVISVSRTGGNLSIALADPRRPNDGQLIVGFDETTRALEQWQVIDRSGRATSVVLSDIHAADNPNSLFVAPPLPRARRGQ